MTLEQVCINVAQELLRLTEEPGAPNTVCNSELSVGALLAGRIGSRYMASLQQAITQLRPEGNLRVFYGVISNSPLRKGFRIEKQEAV